MPLHSAVTALLLLTALGMLGATEKDNLDLSDLQFDLEGCVVGEAAPGTLRRHLGYLMDATSSTQSGDVIENVDSNADGKICWCDVMELLRKSRLERTPKSHSQAPRIDVRPILPKAMEFSILDKDGDGYIRGGAELGALLQRLTSCLGVSRAVAVLQELDRQNHRDMAVSEQEFDDYMTGRSNRKRSAEKQDQA